MQASILLVLLAAAMGTFGMPNGMPNGIASSAPAAPNTYGMIGNYTIMDVGWKGKVFDNGEDVYLNGSSLQHIVEQIKVLNPDHKFVKLPVKEKRQSYPEVCGMLVLVKTHMLSCSRSTPYARTSSSQTELSSALRRARLTWTAFLACATITGAREPAAAFRAATTPESSSAAM